MPVTSTTRKQTNIGNGATTSFPITFPFLKPTNIKVVASANGLESTLAYGVDYTVSGTNCIFTTAPASGVTLTIYRLTDRTRETDYQENGLMSAQALDDDFDRAVMVNQEQQEDISRTTQSSITEASGYQIPGREAMKGNYLAFDPDTGDPIPAPGPMGGGPWSQYANYVIGDIINVGEVLYIALTDNRNKAPASNPTDWEPYQNPNQPRIWNSTKTYNVNDPVFFEGEPYEPNPADMPSAGQSPTTHPAKWLKTGGGGGSVGNIAPDPTGAKGGAGWTGTVSTVANGLTGFATELQITADSVQTIPIPIQLRGEALELRFEAFLNAGTNVTVKMYSDAGATVEIPMTQTGLNPTGKTAFVGQFWAPGATVYLKVAGTGEDLRMTNIFIGRPETVQGAVVSEWQSYTPTFQGFGTPTAVDFKWRRNGSNVEIKGKFTSGTSTATEGRVSLPSGLTTRGDIPTIELVGYLAQNLVTTTGYGILAEPSKDYVCFSQQNASYGLLTKNNGSNIFSSGQIASFFASIPCAQFTSSMTVVGMNEPFFLSNTDVTNADNTVDASTYTGAEGSPVPSVSASPKRKRVVHRALASDERAIIEFRKIGTNTWIPLSDLVWNPASTYWCGAKTDAFVFTTFHGCGLVPVDATHTDVIFGQSASAVSGVSDYTWAQFAAQYDRYRVRISRGGEAWAVPPVVKAGLFLSADISAVAGVAIQYQSQIIDTAGSLTLGTGARMTCKVAGTYKVCGMAYSNSAAAQFILYKNGVAHSVIGFSTTNTYGSLSGEIDLVVGDYVDLRTNNTVTLPGNSATRANASNWVQFTRIGA